MAFAFGNRVKVHTVTTGTGTVELGLPYPGYQTMDQAGIANGDTVSYLIESAGNIWEIGIGTYDSATPSLARTTITDSTNSGSAVSLAGHSTVYILPNRYDLERGDVTLDMFGASDGVAPHTAMAAALAVCNHVLVTKAYTFTGSVAISAAGKTIEQRGAGNVIKGFNGHLFNVSGRNFHFHGGDITANGSTYTGNVFHLATPNGAREYHLNDVRCLDGPTPINILTFGDFAGTNWTNSGGFLTHTAGSTVSAAAAVAVTAGTRYGFIIDVSNMTAGTITVKLSGGTDAEWLEGGASALTIPCNGTFTGHLDAVTGNTTLEIVPSSDFDGRITNTMIFGEAYHFVHVVDADITSRLAIGTCRIASANVDWPAIKFHDSDSPGVGNFEVASCDGGGHLIHVAGSRECRIVGNGGDISTGPNAVGTKIVGNRITDVNPVKRGTSLQFLGNNSASPIWFACKQAEIVGNNWASLVTLDALGIVYDGNRAPNGLTTTANVTGGGNACGIDFSGVESPVILGHAVNQNVKLNNLFINFTPTWNAVSSAPSIGSGILEGRLQFNGLFVILEIFLQFAADTNPGSGAWSFDIPDTADIVTSGLQTVAVPVRRQWFPFSYEDNGTAHANATALMSAAGYTIQMYVSGGTTVFNATSPHTWAANDRLTIKHMYAVT